jgi:glyoxylase-like metal-dependent hydrolase (beta-lactamase superfamily II)
MKPFLVALSLVMTLPATVQAQDVQLTTTEITENLHMLSGKGGNIAVMIGNDGTFVIDDQMAPAVPALLETIKTLGGETPRFLINTHYHFDHTGGNEQIGEGGTTIYSHDNVRKRLAEGSEIPAFNANNPPAPAAALPVVTFSETMHFHINDDTLNAVHIPNAHTDGDSVIYFEKANVLHTGDIFFNGLYPFIDIFNGGSLAGTIGAVQMLLDTTKEETKIIPGHGPLASRADLQAYQDMLTYAHASLLELKKQGRTSKEAIEANPLAEFDAKWGGKLFSTNDWIGLMYGAL